MRKTLERLAAGTRAGAASTTALALAVAPALLAAALTLLVASPAGAAAGSGLDAADRALARDIFRELIEIDTTDEHGATTPAAEAMARRLRAAGFPSADVVVIGPNPRKGNLVARYRGRSGSTLKPLLLLGHLDVVEARREDWSTDPFKFLEKDGYFYGRGTQDMKGDDAVLVVDLIRLKREGFVPDRDIVLALTADEEGGQSNGISWLLEHQRDLVEAEFALNPDSGGVVLDHGKPLTMNFEATEKLYADYQVVATNPGGHSSLPRPDNAIYALTHALDRLEASPFPVELNPVTRAYLERMADIETGATAADIRGVLATPPDPQAEARLARSVPYNSILRTTCVATMLSGGHAPNALPQRAEANVNCRILPGHSQEEVRLDLTRIFADPALTVRYRSDAGELFDHGSDKKAMSPPPPRADVMAALRRASDRLWPGIPLLPIMEAGASDSIYTMMAGIPSYGISGMAIDRDDKRMHGRDERVPVASFDHAVQFYHDLLEFLTSSRH